MTNEQLIGITEELILLSAFLGGFSATFLAAILVVNPQERLANWVVILSAFSACSFIVCATTSIAMVNGLQVGPEAIENSRVSIQTTRIISGLSMALGLFDAFGWTTNGSCSEKGTRATSKL